MSEGKVIVSPAPHLGSGITTDRLMRVVIAALSPAAVMGVYLFGWHALFVVVVAIAAAVLTEYLCLLAVKKPFSQDGSAIVTGLLLAMIVPPDVPLWIPALGSAFAIALGKQVFGGLGHNPLNPALLGRAFLLAAYGQIMTTWRWPADALAWAGAHADAITTATPLRILKEGLLPGNFNVPYWQLLFGNRAGSLGETSALALLAGGIFLIAVKVIDWRIPLSYLGSVAALAVLFGQDPLFHLLSGGLLLGAFFMATDYVTSPLTKRGRVFFGLGCGLLTMLIRRYGGYPEGVCYAILLMNIFVPLLDRATLPRRFGMVKADAK